MPDPRLAGLLAGFDGTPDDMADLLGDIDERLRRPAWQRRAACRSLDPATFYPTSAQGSATAKAVCEACPARSDCLAHALERPELDGIWGGMTPGERLPLQEADEPRAARTRASRENCGTYSAAQRHRRRGEKPCPPCREAAAAYMREHRRRHAS